MNIDKDVATLVGMKEIHNYKLQQDIQDIAVKYNELIATWAFIDGFLKPLMEIQLKLHQKKHARSTVSLVPTSPDFPPPATLFSDQPAEAVIGGRGSKETTA